MGQISVEITNLTTLDNPRSENFKMMEVEKDEERDSSYDNWHQGFRIIKAND